MGDGIVYLTWLILMRCVCVTFRRGANTFSTEVHGRCKVWCRYEQNIWNGVANVGGSKVGSGGHGGVRLMLLNSFLVLAARPHLDLTSLFPCQHLPQSLATWTWPIISRLVWMPVRQPTGKVSKQLVGFAYINWCSLSSLEHVSGFLLSLRHSDSNPQIPRISFCFTSKPQFSLIWWLE